MFEEQVRWAVDAGVDFIVGETFSWAQEALIALDVIKAAKQTAVITLAMHQADVTREDWTVADACKRLADAGADVVGLNCIRGPATMMPLLRAIRRAVTTHDGGAARALPDHRDASRRSSRCATRTGTTTPGSRPFPIALDPFTCNRFEIAEFGRAGARARHPLPRRVLRRGAASHPRAGRGRRQASAGEQVFGRHVEARVPGLARADQAGAEGLRGQAVSRPERDPAARRRLRRASFNPAAGGCSRRSR